MAAVWCVPFPLPSIRLRDTLSLPPYNFLPISREARRRTQAEAGALQPGGLRSGWPGPPRCSARLGGPGCWAWGPRSLVLAPAPARAPAPVRAPRAASRPRELTRPRVSAGIPAPALNMPVIFISLRQAAKAIPPAAAAAATQCFPLVGRGNGGRPDFLITWC